MKLAFRIVGIVSIVGAVLMIVLSGPAQSLGLGVMMFAIPVEIMLGLIQLDGLGRRRAQRKAFERNPTWWVWHASRLRRYRRRDG